MYIYIYINISGLLQIPLSNSNNCYWSVNGQEILSLSRDRRWTRYPVKVHSSLISITQRFTSCENASLLAQENQSKSWSFADVTMEENSVQKGDKPLHLFLMASEKTFHSSILINYQSKSLRLWLTPFLTTGQGNKDCCSLPSDKCSTEGKRAKCTNSSSYGSATSNIQ